MSLVLLLEMRNKAFQTMIRERSDFALRSYITKFVSLVLFVYKWKVLIMNKSKALTNNYRIKML